MERLKIGPYEQAVHECVKYKTYAEHYKKLLTEVKLGILLYTAHNKEAEKHFERILKVLDDNKIKSFMG